MEQEREVINGIEEKDYHRADYRDIFTYSISLIPFFTSKISLYIFYIFSINTGVLDSKFTCRTPESKIYSLVSVFPLFNRRDPYYLGCFLCQTHFKEKGDIPQGT